MINRILERLEALYDMNKKTKRNAYEEQDWEKFDLFMHRNEGVYLATKIVQEVSKEYDWIPVEKKLPKEGTPVLVCNEEGRVYIRQVNWISRGKTKIPYWSQNSNGIIAWKPLDAPYQKGE